MPVGAKMDHPEITPSKWIDVAGCACVVMKIYPRTHHLEFAGWFLIKLNQLLMMLIGTVKNGSFLNALILEDMAETMIHMYDN